MIHFLNILYKTEQTLFIKDLLFSRESDQEMTILGEAYVSRRFTEN